jgi:hypothetical protein
MINIKFEIVNVWVDRFESIFSDTGGTPFEHKFWEIQAIKTNDIVSLDFRITTRCDHAGIDLWIGLLGYSINFTFYDNRHWNYITGDYEKEHV